MSLFDPVWNSVWNSTWNKLWGDGSSAGNLFNGTYAFYPFATNGNNTIVQTTKINTRLGDKNAANDAGQLLTVPEYTTFFTGSGELDEPSATNLAWASNVQPIDLSRCFPQNGGSEALVDAGNSVIDAGFLPTHNGLVYQLTSDPSQSSSQLLFTGTQTDDIGEVASLDCWARVVQQGEQEAQLRFSNYSEVGANTVITGSEWKRYTMTFATPIGQGGRLLSVSCIGTGVIPTIVQIIGTQSLNGYPSSLIEANNVSNSTRDSDKPTAPSSNAWVDTAFLGDFTGANYILGVNTTANFITFTQSAGNAGKYFTKVTQNWTGAIAVAENGAVIILTYLNNSICSYSTSNTAQEIQAGFEYPNEFQIAFQYSVYGDNQDLAGIKQLSADVGDYPPTKMPTTVDNYVSSSPIVTVDGNKFTLNGSNSGGTLASCDVTGRAIVDSAFIHVNATASGTNLNEILLLGSPDGAVSAGTNDYYLPPGGSIPTPILGVPLLTRLSSTTLSFDSEITINSIEVLQWLDWPTKNFTTSFKFTPKALTGAIDSIIIVEDTANNQGYFVSIPDVNYDSFQLTVFEGANVVNIAIPILGGINLEQEYSIEISITDSTVYFVINGDSTSVPNTVTFLAGNWNARIPLAGSVEATYTCKIADLECKDYQP